MANLPLRARSMRGMFSDTALHGDNGMCMNQSTGSTYFLCSLRTTVEVVFAKKDFLENLEDKSYVSWRAMEDRCV